MRGREGKGQGGEEGEEAAGGGHGCRYSREIDSLLVNFNFLAVSGMVIDRDWEGRDRLQKVMR